MHVELVVPALFSAVPPPRLPALELLLARGREDDEDQSSLEEWLARAFRLSLPEGAAFPAGALSAHGHGESAGTGVWLRADPVHLRADRDRALLLPSQAFPVSEAEAAALAASIAPLLEGRYVLVRVRPDQWCLRALEGSVQAGASAKAPIELAGADVDSNLPAKAWHPLLTELQMAMYDHPVNAAREARGDPVLNSVWLWGDGALPAAAPGPWQTISADDPATLGLGRLAGIRHRGIPAGAGEWLERAPEEGRHLVVLDALRGAAALGDSEGLAGRLAALEQRWFAPLLAALKAQRIGMVSIHVPDAGARFETIRGDLRRIWRRPKPLRVNAAR
jgi:hypothetical protein